MDQLVTTNSAAPIKLKTKDRNVDADCKEFGRRLAVLLDKNGFTQSDLAKFMGVSRSGANWWVQGKTYPSIANAQRIADFLRTTPEYLIYGAVKAPKERLVESIPVIDRVEGKQSLVTRITIPREFMARHNMPETAHLRAVTMFSEHPVEGVSKGDIVIADISDKRLTETPRRMVLDNGDKVSVGLVSKGKGKAKVHVAMDGIEFDMPVTEGLVVGRVVASLSAAAA